MSCGTSLKFLGVTVSSTLDWSLHIQCTCSRAKILGVIYRSFGLADQVCISRLYKTLVWLVLEYCDCVWDPYQTKYINMLEGVQSLAGRIATRRWHGSATAIRKLLKWPLLASRRRYHKLLLCRKILTGISIIPQSVFTPHLYSSVRLPNPCPIFIPSICSNYHRSSFFVSSIPLWNSLSLSLVGLSSYLAFKRHLKLFLQV